MAEELIAKKDLLEETAISYGQLYRWKRKNLIPEEWFIRKATFTGQETFFPKEKILKRIEKIKQMKDTLSLDELADLFSPQSAQKMVMDKDRLVDCNIVSKMTLDFFFKQEGERDHFQFDQLLSLFLLEKLLRTGDITLEEGAGLLRILKEHGGDAYDKNSSLILIRKMGVPVFLILTQDGDVYFDDLAKVVARIRLPASIEELSSLIRKHGGTLEQ